MGYLEKVLQPNESVIHRAKVHWVVYLTPAIILAVGIGLCAYGNSNPELYWLFAVGVAFIILFVPYAWLDAFIRRWTTELAVTDKRVLVKTGWIRRDTSEINRSRVEGVSINQSVLGRLLGYGTVGVTGTGGKLAPVKDVDDPLKFRKHVITE